MIRGYIWKRLVADRLNLVAEMLREVNYYRLKPIAWWADMGYAEQKGIR